MQTGRAPAARVSENLKTREGPTLPVTGTRRCWNCALVARKYRTPETHGEHRARNTFARETSSHRSESDRRRLHRDFAIAAADRARGDAETFAEQARERAPILETAGQRDLRDRER